MIRFVDLSESYWTDPETRQPCCAFLNTVDDCFLKSLDGAHVFDSADDLEGIVPDDLRKRCNQLVPEDFWTSKSSEGP